jgi:cytochrome c-type biogenesis protein CcmH
MTSYTTLYLLMLGLSLLLMTPLIFLVRRSRLRDRRAAALDLHKAQLAELARDRADGRIGEAEYNAAKIEVERRVLTADGFTEPAMTGNARLLLIGTVIAIPIMAFALYLPGSTPGVPSEPHAQWVIQQNNANAKLIGFIAGLRMHLASVAPNSVDASQGEAYLAEALSEQAGQITPEALSYFKQSLANAPATASWRALDEQRIAQGNATVNATQ